MNSTPTSVRIESGGYYFTCSRQTYELEPEVLPGFELALGQRGVVGIERQGAEGTSAWVVDHYFPEDSGGMTAEEARKLAHALLGAAGLAERLNREGDEVLL